MVKKDPMTSRAFKVREDEWNAAKELADQGTEPRRVVVPLKGDESLSEAMREFLRRFVG